MLKEKLTDHLREVSQRKILTSVRKHEGEDIGVDNFNISDQAALGAGINRYHLPQRVAMWLAEPAIEATVALTTNYNPTHKLQMPNPEIGANDTTNNITR